MSDTLAPDAVEPHLDGRFGKPYLYEPECASTQQLLLGSGLPEGAVAVTDHQTGGRGRLGRAWEEPAGTLRAHLGAAPAAGRPHGCPSSRWSPRSR